MTNQLNNKFFESFIQLRDALRAAKREKDYQRVLSIGLSILELDKFATVLKIATPSVSKRHGRGIYQVGQHYLRYPVFAGCEGRI